MKFIKLKDKKWVILPTTMWADECCECGLIHINELKTSDKGVEYRCWRANDKEILESNHQ